MLSDRDDTTRLTRTAPDMDSLIPGERSEGVLTVLRGPNAGSLFTLDTQRVILGRSGEAHVLLTDRAMSRRHACIAREADGYYLQDLGSANGTFVDGQEATTPIRLQDGSRIEMGAHTILRFALHDRLEQEAARRTHELMIRDPLTHVFNRRHLEERLQSEAAFAQRHGTPLSVLLVDLDHFKQVNDTFGHEAGDSVLRVIARALERTLRVEDVLGRWGGEEFVIVARGIDREGTLTLGERIRRAIEVLRVPAGKRAIAVTASIGIAHLFGEVDAQQMLRAADEAMYAAKAGGRNRVEIAAARQSGTMRRGRQSADRYPTDPIRPRQD
ncbi:MAG: GGDEF domain-containing protein, partial [Myxococcales bacterium]|nr:GGDEF domain-containing protein [Myxococcales bacterium]